MIIPVWAPQTQASPSTPRNFFPVPDTEKSFFMEFSCANQPLGRIVIKVLDGAGQAGLEFESLVTGKEGFGYKGSRVYACCNNEWCLMGDLLYQEPPAKLRQITDWDPRKPQDHKEEEDEGGGGGPSYRQLYEYRGRRRVVRAQEQVITRQPDTRGSVVSVATDYDMGTRTWTFGPQIKICLSDSLLRSGHVLGTVAEGMEVAQRLSRMGGKGWDPEDRITISDCGALQLNSDPPR